MNYGYIFGCIFIGFLFPLLFWKAKGFYKWIPALIFTLGSVLLFIKAKFFPGDGFDNLAEFIVLLSLLLADIGSILSALFIKLTKSLKSS